MVQATRKDRDSPAVGGAHGRLEARARGAARSLIRQAVRRGAPPRWFGWRHVEPVPLSDAATRHDVIHPPERASNPQPRNVRSRADLPDMRHWWGYSFRDVPDRQSGETAVGTVRDATVVSYRRDDGAFFPAILSGSGHSVDMREIRFRNGHAEAMRAARASGLPAAHRDRAVWALERVHDNHSHWLTAHLPKLILLERMRLLEDVLLPERLSHTQEASLRLLGHDPARFARFDETRPLHVGELTLVETDRFRPELLRTVRDRLAPGLPASERTRRLYVSRARARFRRLENEEDILPMLEMRGFERVFLEDHDFASQIDLMAHAEVVVAPHGAGLTNVMFCAEGTHVAEIASPRFPNPNFYAVAAAMGHHYYIVNAEERGDAAPLERDISVDPERLRGVLDMIDGAIGRE